LRMQSDKLQADGPTPFDGVRCVVAMLDGEPSRLTPPLMESGRGCPYISPSPPKSSIDLMMLMPPHPTT
jgi:hypothetical protein